MIGYVFLSFAILLSVAGNVYMKLSNGFRNTPATIAALILYAIVPVQLILAVQYMEVGIAYAIWAGSVILLVAVIGILFLQEKQDLQKISALALIAVGVSVLQAS
ncbi:multidrug efflux SMR transporter [Geomicrobium sp. JCM 19039]|uniref:DMT family transporter n=1 Tax=Geomicrobium sp. JCM 19039 TaxID=1460636 RepID=UPI00045F4CBD|nr:SMR family transporter [Geomicrobium sp. JCM 19039]GAK12470.1 ethidium bromide-methyl viologen resistance protein EmrE [Geomicrobium sp. JCM 19039]